MPKTDFDRIFDQFDAISVGFAPFFRNLQSITPNYPPHNIIKMTDNVYILEIAVAGFKKQGVTIQEHQGELTVTGKRLVEDDENYQYRGLGKRDFEKKFKLAEFIEVVDAQMADGLLSITLMRNVPEENQPKLIAIK